MLIYSAVMHVLKQLQRQCPKCGHRQIVPTRLAESPVACNICHSEIKATIAR